MTQEGALKISSFIKIPLLLETEEMEKCLAFLIEKEGDLSFYNTFSVCDENQGIYQPNAFLEKYRSYIDALKGKNVGELRKSYPFFSHALSRTSDIFYEVSLENKKRVIKAVKPPIQLQPHEFTFSKESETFYSMVYSEKSVSFGVQFSYPNLFQDPHTHEVYNVDETFPNTSLFKSLRLWIRENTSPTLLVVNGKRFNLPYRIGKNCLSWIGEHPQFKEHSIELYVKTPQSIA